MTSRARRAPAAPGSANHVGGIDGLRGIAALLVIVFHCFVQAGFTRLDGGWLRDFIGAGYFGVDLFFVLSGFVLFVPMVRRGGDPGPARNYVFRRAGRIVPAYAAALAVAYFLTSWVTIAKEPIDVSLLGGLSHLVFLQTPVLGLSPELGFGAVGQAWTLSHEAIFYVALFLVAPVFARRPVGAFLVALAGTLLWRAGIVTLTEPGSTLHANLSIQVPSYALHFALGMLVAVIHVRQPPAARLSFGRIAPLLGLLATAAAVTLMVRQGHRGFTGASSVGDHHLRNIALSFAFAVLLLSIVNGPARVRRALEVRPLVWLGEISYGAYLYHLFLIGIALRLLGTTPDGSLASFVSLLGWTLVATCLVARVSYVAFEQPIRAWCRRQGEVRVPSRPRDRRLPARVPARAR